MHCLRQKIVSRSLISLALLLRSHQTSLATATESSNSFQLLRDQAYRHSIETKGLFSAKMSRNENNDDDERKKDIREIIRTESRGYDIDSPNNVPKRSDYLSWNDYFLAVAYLSAQRSKDPHPSNNSRDGACIVDTMGRIVGIGYDGFPRGCSDDCLPWASASVAGDATEEELDWLHTREPYLCHAEINAILNKCSADVVGGRMFVPNFPCKPNLSVVLQMILVAITHQFQCS